MIVAPPRMLYDEFYELEDEFEVNNTTIKRTGFSVTCDDKNQ